MKIAFAADGHSLARGSYRMWVRDAAEALAETGVSVSTFSLQELAGLHDFDGVVLLDKAATAKAEIPKQRNYLVGAINPPEHAAAKADFAVVGSIEEKVALARSFPLAFIWPLVERQFESAKPRDHIDLDVVTVGYHGNSLHLGAMRSSGLADALVQFKNRLERMNRSLRLKVITETAQPNWKVGRPAVSIEFIKYDLARVMDDIQTVDIGVVPNAHFGRANPFLSKLQRRFVSLDVSKNDYVMRFKEKSNFGRALVFQQLGVPVVADLTPSNVDLIRDGETGYIAGNTASWFQSLSSLVDAPARKKIADAAHERMIGRFKTVDIAKNFLSFLATPSLIREP